MQYEVLLGTFIPPGCHAGVGWRQRGGVLGACRAPGALPVRSRRRAPRPPASACRKSPTRSFTASCQACRLGRSMACAPMVPGPRSAAPVQSEPPAARPLCQGADRAVPLDRVPLVDPADPFALDPRDTAASVPKGVWPPPAPSDRRAGTPWAETVLYEAHVRGMTMLHQGVPASLRGTYLGLADPAVLDHLVRLGVTAVELMPVWAFLDEQRLVRLGLSNYWGYNPYAFFAAEPRFALREPMAEFRTMVAALHDAGIEVILDVVLNHTAETDSRPHAVAARPGQCQLLPTRSRRPFSLPGLDGLRQLFEFGPSTRAAARHGRVAALGGTGCRRLSLRPGAGTGARRDRRVPARCGAAPGHGAGPVLAA